MQETLALGAIVLSLLSYVIVAVGPSDPASREVVQRPLEVLAISGATSRIDRVDDVVRARQLSRARASGSRAEVQIAPYPELLPPSSSGAAYPWRVTPAPRTKGRVVFTWLSGSPGDRGSAPFARPPERAEGNSRVDEVLDLGRNRVLKRHGEGPALFGDLLTDEVIGRYRLYASELAELRERQDIGPEPGIPA